MEQLTSPTPNPDPERDGPARPGPDRATRQAAIWATVVAVPLSLLVVFLLFARLTPDAPQKDPDDGPPGAAATATPAARSTAPVELPAPALARRPATVCRALLSRLPATVRDLAQRPVTAGAEQNAAYGDPALAVQCGVPPARAASTDDVWTVNRVCWHAAQPPGTTGATGATVLTTVDREVPVRVTVPGAYEQPLQWLAPVADAVVASVPSAEAESVPSGCTR